jgi:hypothetical protein
VEGKMSAIKTSDSRREGAKTAVDSSPAVTKQANGENEDSRFCRNDEPDESV